ncbi:MAG: hypothetical protein ACYDAC_01390 [Candidatus Dormibacteria bacterium]
MEAINSVATCPHCGLALDAPPAPPPETASSAAPPPIRDDLEWSELWMTPPSAGPPPIQSAALPDAAPASPDCEAFPAAPLADLPAAVDDLTPLEAYMPTAGTTPEVDSVPTDGTVVEVDIAATNHGSVAVPGAAPPAPAETDAWHLTGLETTDFDMAFSTAFAVDEPQYEPVDDVPARPVDDVPARPVESPDGWDAVASAAVPAAAETSPPLLTETVLRWQDPDAQPAVAIAADHASSDGAAAPATAGAAAPATAGDVPGWGIREAAASRGSGVGAVAASGQQSSPAASPSAVAGGRGRQAPSQRTRRLAISGVALGVLGAVTYAGFASGSLGNLFRSSRLVAPAAIGSLSRILTPQADSILAGVQHQLRASSSAQAVAAVYGAGTTPQLVFVAYGGAAMQTSDQLVASVNASSTPFTQKPTVSTVGGQQYVCGTVGGGSAPSVICTWTDAQAAGYLVLINSTDVSGALTLAAEARTGSEG